MKTWLTALAVLVALPLLHSLSPACASAQRDALNEDEVAERGVLAGFTGLGVIAGMAVATFPGRGRGDDALESLSAGSSVIVGAASAVTAFYGAGQSEEAFLFQAISTAAGMFVSLYDVVALAVGRGCDELCTKLAISLPIFLGAVVGLLGASIIDASAEGSAGDASPGPEPATGMSLPLVFSF